MQQEQIDLGHKRTCPHCGAKYYDFYQEELDCPQCGKSIEAINITKPKRGRKAGINAATPSKRNMRRSHHRAGTQLFAEDKKSGELRRPHHIDLSTGMYRGKQIIIKKSKKDKEAEGQAPVNTDETTKTIEAPAASK